MNHATTLRPSSPASSAGPLTGQPSIRQPSAATVAGSLHADPTRRTAHRRAVERGLDEPTFEVFMGHFRTTLEELGVPEPKIGEIMAIAECGRDDVLNR